MKSGEKMRSIAQQVERSTQEQSRGSRQITQAMESINSMVGQLGSVQRTQSRSAERGIALTGRLDEAARKQDVALRDASTHAERLKKSATNGA
jgi:methyl-accepting chemotaxis protein